MVKNLFSSQTTDFSHDLLPLEIFLSQIFLPSPKSVFFSPSLGHLCLICFHHWSKTFRVSKEKNGSKWPRDFKPRDAISKGLENHQGNSFRSACSSQELQKCSSQEGINSLALKLLRRKAENVISFASNPTVFQGTKIWTGSFENRSLGRVGAGAKWERWVWGQTSPACFALGFATKAARRREGRLRYSMLLIPALFFCFISFFFKILGDLWDPSAPLPCEHFISLHVAKVQSRLVQTGSGKKPPRTPQWWARGGHSTPSRFPFDRLFPLSFGSGKKPAKISPNLS